MHFLSVGNMLTSLRKLRRKIFEEIDDDQKDWSERKRNNPSYSDVVFDDHFCYDDDDFDNYGYMGEFD